MKTCSVDACGRPHLARGWCKLHYTRWHKHGDPAIVARGGGGDGLGADSRSWRGETVSYSAAHMRVRTLRGPASRHLCECGSPAAHWSYDHADPGERTAPERNGAAYSTDPTHYMPRCVPCHKRFDLNQTVLGRA